MEKRITRRRASQLLGWWVVLSAAPVLADRRDADAIPPKAREMPAKLIRAMESALAVGALYLSHHPEQADPEALAQLLGLSGIDIGGLDHREATKHRTRLQGLHRADFEDDRTEELAGFYLSSTESRLAALITLISS